MSCPNSPGGIIRRLLKGQRPSEDSRLVDRTIIFSGILLTFFVCLLYLFPPYFLSLVSLKVYDSMVGRQAGESSQELVIVDIDEDSLTTFGQWPWPRYRMANLINQLDSLGAAVIGLDILFPEADRTSLDLLKKEIERDLDISIQLENAGRYDNDQTFARALEGSNSVLGYRFLFRGEKVSSAQYQPHRIKSVLRRQNPSAAPLTVYRARGLTGNMEELSQAVSLSGFINYLPDADGMIRRVPLLIEYEKEYYPSLSLAVIMEFFNTRKILLNVYGDKLESLTVSDTTVPLDGKGNLVLRYNGIDRAFTSYSAADVLNKKIKKKDVEGKIILIGTSATGLQDRHPTPVDPVYPGIFVHATIIDNILNGQYFIAPIWARGVELALVVVMGLIITFFLARMSAVFGVFFILVSITGAWYGTYILLHSSGIILNPHYIVLVLVLNFTVLTVCRFWFEQREVRKRTRELLMAQDTAILSMTALTETRDNETGGHILRTQHYVKVLAQRLAEQEKFMSMLSKNTIDLLFRSAPLHDIGKVGISDQILLNPGRLTSDEYEEMKEHTRFGYDILVKAEARLKDEGGHSFLQTAREIALNHHEKWDGTGYPNGLKGEDIPLAGRLMALADVYDALISKRRYKPALSHDIAAEVIKRNRGTHFDPEIVDAFLEKEESFMEIASTYSDKAMTA